jgi:UDP-N-acetylmuramate: L-alanyl-gamma-D-glutamyl-meso-diaminopimelate ligase
MGIGGAALGSLAELLQDLGYRVRGADNVSLRPSYGVVDDRESPVPDARADDAVQPQPDLVVVGEEICPGDDEATALLASNVPYTSMPALLGEAFVKPAHSIVVAGTHGKTTTTALTAWLLDVVGFDPGFVVGGAVANFGRDARAGSRTHIVIEGEERDTAFFDNRPKFAHYPAKTVILTSVAFDPAGTYRDLDQVKDAFRMLVRAIPDDGVLIARWDDANVRDVAAEARCEVWRYGPTHAWDGRILDVDPHTGRMRFQLTHNGQPLGMFESCMGGTHNLYNQVAAAAAAVRSGATAEHLTEGFATFGGIKRHQEVIGEPAQITVIDDVAHHPTAVRVTLEALRLRYGGRRLWAIWEPHSATSQRNGSPSAYTEAFDAADQVVLAEPSDNASLAEGEGEGFSSSGLAEALTQRGVDAITLPDTEAILDVVVARARPMDIIAILTHGAFDGLHQRLVDGLEARFGTPIP